MITQSEEKTDAPDKQGSGDPVSVFRFDAKPGREDAIEKAKAAAKRLKTLRHPNILTFVDSQEVCSPSHSVT